MANVNKEQKKTGAKATEYDSLWRKPITLDLFEDDDPLATLYQGREVGKINADDQIQTPTNVEKDFNPAINKESEIAGTREKALPATVKKEAQGSQTVKKQKNTNTLTTPKISDAELKSLLKIKSESYHFTDLREILRGKSFDIYAYLRLLSGDKGVCKIKHLDLMKKLDISRPTLFKQGEWLMKLGLIEKRNVPGDHLGTSYIIRPLEEVLPISEELITQLDSQIESFRQANT